MKLSIEKRYNLKWAKDEVKREKTYAKDMIKIYSNHKKEIENALSFLNFETDCHENYGEEYTYNQDEKNIMLKNYECKKHFDFLLNRYKKRIEDETNKANRTVSFYLDDKYNFTHNR